MVVILHVLIAISSILSASFAFIKPTKMKCYISYALIAATLASGVYLVWATPAKMLHVCLSGVLYSIIAGALAGMARVRLMKHKKSEQMQ